MQYYSNGHFDTETQDISLSSDSNYKRTFMT